MKFIILSMVACFVNDMNKDVYYIPTSSLTSKTFILSHFLRSPIWSKQLGENHSPSTYLIPMGKGGGGLATVFFSLSIPCPLDRRGAGGGGGGGGAKCWTNPSSRLPPEAAPSASLIGCTVQCDL